MMPGRYHLDFSAAGMAIDSQEELIVFASS